MFGFILFLIACGTCSRAQEGETIVPLDNKTECINQLAQWCDGMQYPQQGVGMAMLSLTYEDPDAYYRVFCSSDSEGTNCTRNKESWFTCSPNHILTYKGKILTNISKDVDDDICMTADKALNELFIQNLSYDNTTMKQEVQKGMEAFFEQMAIMEEQIALIQRMLRRIPSIPADLWREFNDNFVFQEDPSITDSMATTTAPSGNNTRNSTELQQSNQTGN